MSILHTYDTTEIADELMERVIHTNGLEFVPEYLRFALIGALTGKSQRTNIWQMYITAIVLAFTGVVGVLGYALCFEDTSLGGWLPFMFILAGPLVGWFAAKVSRG
jgi:uncharacterized membrane protein YecN with MAPEG domain